MVYLVSIASQGTRQVEHCVLKLDHKGKKTRTDEIARHNQVRSISPTNFVNKHIPELLFERVESEDTVGIFYAIAGQSLRNYRPLSSYKRQDQLEAIFAATYQHLLLEWNPEPAFEQAQHPKTLLKKWLGFRLEKGGKIEQFLRKVCQVDPDSPGFLVRGNVFPNPLRYAHNQDARGTARPIDVLLGLQHGDLNTNNILVNFSGAGNDLSGYYLIDFALFKEKMPLLFDLRYLEMSYLLLAASQSSLSAGIDLMIHLSEEEIPTLQEIPIEMAGAGTVIRTGRTAFKQWIHDKNPTLHDDLWAQYWLAGVAAGLSYCHKSGQPDEYRLAGLLYAAANLKKYAALFDLPLPSEARQLFDESLFDSSKGKRTASGSLGKGIPNNLPSPPTKFIGRAKQIAAIEEMLLQPDIRLITLTGPGGTGKTRVGLEVCRAVMGHFPDGVYFVDLAPIRDPDLVLTTTAHMIGIREGGGRPPLENMKVYLSGKQVLLLFDNFEQVAKAASVVAELMAAVPGVKILVTSRIPLQVRGEHEYPISPLDLPSDSRPAPADILEYEAVALFHQQAQSVQPNFEIADENKDVVIEICRRLDGLPLAIEIAAARIKIFSPQALLKRLDKSLKLLVGGTTDSPDRQQTLRSTIDWSYELLAPEIQTLFTRLGIFSGGFTLEAAEKVCNIAAEIDVLAGIETLLNSSLLRRVPSVSNEPRFDMLQTIRDYALEKADNAEINTELHQGHCSYYANLARSEWDSGVFGPQAVMWLQRINEEHDNLRIALAWALEHPENAPAAIAMLTPLTWFWYRYGYLHEGHDWTQRALAATDGYGDTPMRALALIGRAYLALWSGDLFLAVQHAREAVEMCERLHFDVGLSMAKLGYGVALINRGKDKEAYPHLVDAAELFDQQNHTINKGISLVHLANVSLGLGDPNDSIKWLDTAMPYMKESGDLWCMAFALNNYGEVARTLGDYEKAEQYYRHTEKLYEQADARGDQARLVHTFAYIAMHKGNLDEAQALFEESLNAFRKLGNHRGIAECLAGLAGLAAERGKYNWAVPLLGAAESQLTAFGGAWWPADRVEIDRSQKRMRSALQDEFDALWAQGQAMDVDEAIAYAVTS